jgi:hypothetical protein
MKRLARLTTALVIPALMAGVIPAPSVIAGAVATISGRAWDDVDDDGRQDGSEGGLALTVALLDTGGQVVTTTTSSLPEGRYSLQVPEAGDYRVRFDKTSVMRASLKDEPVVGDRYDSDIDAQGVTDLITVGTTDIGRVDAGFVLADQTGQLYVDRNASGARSPGEPGVADVRVDLVRGLSNPVIVDTTVTDEDGEFRLLLPTGATDTLRFRVHVPDGYTRARRNEAIGRLDADGYSPVIKLTHRDILLGLFRPVRVGDRVWQDANLDGRQDAGEGGVQGVAVYLWDADLERVFAATVTNRSGRFTLVAPAPGVYRITTALPYGAKRSPMRDDLPEGVDSDIQRGGQEGGSSLEFRLTVGGDRVDLDVGMKVK